MNIKERMDEAMIYLSETDELLADLETEAEKMEQKAAAVKAAIYLHETGTVPERQAKAQTASEYWEAFEEYLSAKNAARKVLNKRKTHDRAIDVLRSIEASRRKA